MFTNIKNRFISVISPDMPPLPSSHGTSSTSQYNRLNHNNQSHMRSSLYTLHEEKSDKFAYARPAFLDLLTQDELKASADHHVRPIIVPRDISLLPWGTGYAECVNSGKSEWNEDQTACSRQVLSDPTHKNPDLPYTYFGIFDGHAGYGAALAASYQFHHILHEKLVDCIDLLLRRDDEDVTVTNANTNTNGFLHPSQFQRRVSKEELIIGALEAAFLHMDSLLAQDRARYRDAGGCTACVSLFIDGKMYVANAGDSRAVLSQRKSVTKSNENSSEHLNDNNTNLDVENTFPVPFSFDHTPETERHRLLTVARLRPNLLGTHYAAMEYTRRPHNRDLGQRILCRQGTMQGWTYKTLAIEDLRMPVVAGEGKRSRLLGTLGVTRGFGDHNLLAINTGTLIKPFLTPQPDVNYRDLTKIVSIPGENNEDGDYGVLIMATDGLWDVSENDTVARTVFQTLSKFPTEKHRYTMVAQELVARARGKINDSGHWRLADSRAAATVDDISVIVIPVYQYYKEHMSWVQKCAQQQEIQEKSLNIETALQATTLNGTQHDVDDANNYTNDDDDEGEEVIVDVQNPKTVMAIVEEEIKEEITEETTVDSADNLITNKNEDMKLVEDEISDTVGGMKRAQISGKKKNLDKASAKSKNENKQT